MKPNPKTVFALMVTTLKSYQKATDPIGQMAQILTKYEKVVFSPF